MLPLEGIRVLDLSHMVLGPYCSMLLGDLGANVTLIEPPPQVLHMSRDPTNPLAADIAYFHPSYGRNKRSIVLNLRMEEGRQAFYKLAQSADVIVVEEFPAGRMKRLGVDYEAISQINPRIVYCSASSYGRDGPYRDLPGHDMTVLATGGILSMIGWPDTPPAIPVNIIGDMAGGGLFAAFAILAALIARQHTGRGQLIDMAMADGALSLATGLVAHYQASGSLFLRGQTHLNGVAPYYNVYQTKDDRWISIGCLEPHLYASLCQALGCEDLIPHQYDRERWPEIFQRFRAIFVTKTRDEWFQYLKDKGVCVAPVYTLDEALKDPHNRHRQMVIEVDDPQLGKLTQVGIAPKFSETPGSVRSPAPSPGQHTDEVLTEAGYSQADIARLRELGAVA